VPTSEDNWRKWSVGDWSKRLLDHYFAKDGADEEPVRVIVAVDTEFSSITGDLETDPADIVAGFIEKVNRAVGSRNLWKVASEKADLFSPREALAFLILGCVVAVDLEEDDPNGFLDRFDKNTNGRGTNGIQAMATLWEGLRDWLNDHQESYRCLELPDPGGRTRIGHTVLLAFPPRRAQLELFELLEARGLNIEAPPIDPVRSVVASNLTRFRARFREQFTAFEEKVKHGASQQELYETPFWDAVTTAVQLSPSIARDSSRQQWSLVADDDGYDLDLRLVTDASTCPHGIDLAEGAEDHRWAFEAGEDACKIVFAGQVRLGRLSALISGGVVPFVEQAGVFEVAPKQDMTLSRLALVHHDLVEPFVRHFGGTSEPVTELPDWCVVRESAISLSSTEVLAGGPFDSVWVLHDTPFPRTIQAIGGVRVESGLLGLPGNLPHFRAFGATTMLGESSDSAWELEHVDGTFLLPVAVQRAGIEGQLRISADFSDGPTREKIFTFAPAPITEDYRVLGDMDPWVVEWAVKGEYLWQRTEPDEPPTLSDADVSVYLGANVGEFVESRAGAAWEVIEFGRGHIARCLVDDPKPRARSRDAAARRRWRKLLGSAHGLTAAERSLANMVRMPQEDLPLLESEREWTPTKEAEPDTPRKPSLDPLVAVIAAIANNRAGLPMQTILQLLETYLGVRGALLWQVLRSWTESGAFEVASSVRFASRLVFPVQPRLELFTTDVLVGARLTGLALPRTLDAVASAAESLGVAWRIQHAALGMTPPALTLRSTGLEQLQEVARLAGISWAYLPGLKSNAPASDGRSELATHQPRGAPSGPPEWPTCKVQKWAHPRSPAYWQAVGLDRTLFFLHRENALFASAALAGTRLVERTGRSLTSGPAHIPLPLARRINAVAPIVSGPTPTGGYAYHCPTVEAARRVGASIEDLAGQVADSTSRDGSCGDV
jgi:hypothetical protein